MKDLFSYRLFTRRRRTCNHIESSPVLPRRSRAGGTLEAVVRRRVLIEGATAKLVANLRAYPAIQVSVAKSVAEAVRGADIVTTVTADKAYATILTPEMIEPGMHLNAVGGDFICSSCRAREAAFGCIAAVIALPLRGSRGHDQACKRGHDHDVCHPRNGLCQEGQ